MMAVGFCLHEFYVIVNILALKYSGIVLTVSNICTNINVLMNNTLNIKIATLPPNY